MVRQWQKLFYGHRFSQTDPHRKTDFVALAEAFGIKGMRIHNDSEVSDVLKAAFDSGEAVVIDCCISPDENVLPMIPPGKTVDDMRIAAKNGADMITFPELQLSPFFPKYHSKKRQCVDLSCLCFSNMFC